ncbi:MAG: hypothetical protein IKP88_09510 [Lachnospiraceae bacterium]|nr:hypothetical protein [Lachnospiraceae bacterium]
MAKEFDYNENNFNTEYVMRELETCEEIAALKEEILPKLQARKEQWQQKINEIINNTGYTKTHFAELCNTSRVTVDKWCKGSIPKRRDIFLTIGLAANYDLEEMNLFLQRYGQYPELYSKSLEDCVCIFVIKNYNEDRVQKYREILERIKKNIIRSDESDNADVGTVEFRDKLFNVKDEDELDRFITDNSAIFSKAYYNLYTHVKMSIEVNSNSSSAFEMAEAQGWSSSLRQCVSKIYQRKWYPTRNKIISLGLHLGMDHEEIDEMLGEAHMEPLYAKNIFESIIIYILEDAGLNNLLGMEADNDDPDAFLKFALKKMKELDIPEVDDFISEISGVEDEW